MDTELSIHHSVCRRSASNRAGMQVFNYEGAIRGVSCLF